MTSEKTIHPVDGQFVRPVIACEAQGTAVCHVEGYCSTCPFAYAKLNPKKTLHFWLEEVNK